MLSFEIGSPIVHPIHGAGILREIQKREIRGKVMKYYIIDFPYSDLGQVMVPIDMAEKVGLRTITLGNSIDSIFEVLGESFTEAEEEEIKSFHQRYREYLEKIQSGELSQVAYVYRLLFRRSLVKPLGTKDKALFETARQLLVSEIVYAKRISEDDARDMLDTAMEEVVF
ncbi:MAG TPA: CarD family transcriptional regulator [Candidatus Ozemobacteraceae bacterium]|nr:CarD family transcriptional regulator [Candidatus Ozemobacteraceae bacterium]